MGKKPKKPKERVRPYMICICSEEGLKDAEELQQIVTDHIWGGQSPPENSPHGLLDWVVHHLNDAGVDIKGIPSDMWLAVSAEDKKRNYFCQADRVLDALCSLYAVAVMGWDGKDGPYDPKKEQDAPQDEVVVRD